jgi:precorrin-6Y C5,15-methyltransferase (decarboxylating)
MGINLINQNLEVFSLSNLKAVSGNAPNVLNGLPDPDRIFIGGSGGKLIEILNYADERLAINGRIVLALASLENLQEATSWFKEKSWKYQIMQVQISRSASFAKLTRMLPLNPVTIVSAFNETY